MPENPDQWAEWSKHVLRELERLNGVMEGMREEMGKMKTEVAMLKMKSGLWGAMGATIPIAVMVAVQILLK